MTTSEEIDHLLKTHGAVLERKTKHKVWRFPDGRIFVQASTLSDSRSGELNSLSDLRKMLGIKRDIHKNPERKRKQGAMKSSYHPEVIAIKPDWKEQLRAMAEEKTEFIPQLNCAPVRLERIPMTPLWCILRCAFGYGGRK